MPPVLLKRSRNENKGNFAKGVNYMSYIDKMRLNAPVLAFKGFKIRGEEDYQSYIIPQELADIIFNTLGNSSAQIRIMIVLCGTKPGFAVSEDWILKRTGLSHSPYIAARKALADIGWIDFEPYKSITVNFDMIYQCEDIPGYRENEIKEKKEKRNLKRNYDRTSGRNYDSTYNI